MLTTGTPAVTPRTEPNDQFEKSMIGVCEKCGADGEFDVKWYKAFDHVSGLTRECYLCIHCAHADAAVCHCPACSRKRR